MTGTLEEYFSENPWDKITIPSPRIFEQGVQDGREQEMADMRRDDAALSAVTFTRRYLGAGEPAELSWIGLLRGKQLRGKQLERDTFAVEENTIRYPPHKIELDLRNKEIIRDYETYPQRPQASGQYVLGLAEGRKQVRAEVRADAWRMTLPQLLQKYGLS